MADNFLFKSSSSGYKITVFKTPGVPLTGGTPYPGYIDAFFDAIPGSPPTPAVQLAYGIQAGRSGFFLRVSYLNGLSLDVSGLGRAAGHVGLDPWDLLPTDDERLNRLSEPHGPITSHIVISPSDGGDDQFMNFELLHGSTPTVSDTINYGPVGTLTVASSGSAATPISIVTAASSITPAGRTIAFKTLAELAQFANVDAKTVFGWVGNAPGVTWRAVN